MNSKWKETINFIGLAMLVLLALVVATILWSELNSYPSDFKEMICVDAKLKSVGRLLERGQEIQDNKYLCSNSNCTIHFEEEFEKNEKQIQKILEMDCMEMLSK